MEHSKCFEVLLILRYVILKMQEGNLSSNYCKASSTNMFFLKSRLHKSVTKFEKITQASFLYIDFSNISWNIASVLKYSRFYSMSFWKCRRVICLQITVKPQVLACFFLKSRLHRSATKFEKNHPKSPRWFFMYCL